MKRLSTHDILARKDTIPLVVLTAYTASQARMLDQYVDILLVGDSLGMVIYGMESTLPVTLDMMIAHGAAVVRGSARALVVVDMPFGSYQGSVEQAFSSAAQILAKTGCSAVKLEGGAEMAETIRFLVSRGIPVVGHIGLTPQSFNVLGGYRTQGKSEEEEKALLADALSIEKAGAFALVLEGVTEPVARKISSEVKIPAIGIGASPACDGQVLVTEDMLGLSGGYIPRFVKGYANLTPIVEEAVKQYAQEVKSREFPSAEYCYPYKK